MKEEINMMSLLPNMLEDLVLKELGKLLNLSVHINHSDGKVGYDIVSSIDTVRIVGWDKGKKAAVAVWMQNLDKPEMVHEIAKDMAGALAKSITIKVNRNKKS